MEAALARLAAAGASAWPVAWTRASRQPPHFPACSAVEERYAAALEVREAAESSVEDYASTLATLIPVALRLLVPPPEAASTVHAPPPSGEEGASADCAMKLRFVLLDVLTRLPHNEARSRGVTVARRPPSPQALLLSPSVTAGRALVREPRSGSERWRPCPSRLSR